MKIFPVMMNLEGRLVVVVGSGSVGMRKVRSLLKACATVKLIDPAAKKSENTAGEIKLPEDVELITRKYRREDLRGAVLVFACAGDRETNSRIARDARAAGIPVNTADQNDDCDFFLPAVHTDGDITIAVSSGGLAPALTGVIRDKLADALPDKAAGFAEALAAIRAELKKTLPETQRRQIAKRLAAQTGYETFVAQGISGLRELVTKMIKLQEKF